MYKGKFTSELSMNEVKEYYDELRQKYPRTEEQWADFNILKEKLIAFAYKILDGKTNGDVISEDKDELKMQGVIKRKAGTPREDYEPEYDCEDWIP